MGGVREAVNEQGEKLYYRKGVVEETGEERWYRISPEQAYQLGYGPLTSVDSFLGLAGTVAEGATLGFFDELSGFGSAAAGEIGERLGLAPEKTWAERYADNRDRVRLLLERFEEENPKTALAADLGGSLATGGLSLKLGKLGTKAAQTMAERYAKAAALGAAEGAAAGAGYSEDNEQLAWDALQGAATGAGVGAAGQALLNTAGRLAQHPVIGGAANNLLPERFQIPLKGTREATLANVPPNKQWAVETADRLGFQLTPYERTNINSLGQIEAVMRSRLGSGEAFDAIEEANQKLLNDTVARTIGQEGAVDLREAYERTRLLYKQAHRSNEKLKLSPDMLDQVTVVADEYISGLGRGNRLPRVLDDFADMIVQKGELLPKEFSQVYSKLGQDLQKAANAGDGAMVQVYRELRGILDKAMDEADPVATRYLREARNLHRKRLPLERANVINPATGDVAHGPLARAYRKDTLGYVRGQDNSEAYELAKLYHAFPELVGNSGTATRSQGMKDLLMSYPRSLAAGGYLKNSSYPNKLWGPTTLPTQDALQFLLPLAITGLLEPSED